MKYKGYEIPKRLEPYFEDAINTVRIEEVIYTHENNRLRAEIEVADYHGVNRLSVSEDRVNNWMMYKLGLERANNAYKAHKNEEQARVQRQELIIEQTCSYCKQVDASTRVLPDGMGKTCQDCRDVYESLRIDQLKTKERIKALEGLL